MKSTSFFSLLFFVCCFSMVAQKYDPGTGNTVLLIGQTYQQEYIDYKNGTGLTPSGGSHYSTIFYGAIEQGDDNPNANFLDWIRSTQSNPYALVALSIKDNTMAGGYGQMTRDDLGDFNPNAVWDACVAINNGEWDTQIDALANTFAQRSDVKFYVRIGYEVSLFLFAYKGEEYCNDWLADKANSGINVFEDPDSIDELDRHAYINAYNYIARRIRNIASNVDFVYHPVRGFNDTKWLYPGDQYVDFVGFSIFNNDICLEVNGTTNCEGNEIDPQLQKSIDFAKEKGKPIMIAEAAVQYPSTETADGFNLYLDRLHNVVTSNDVRVLAYINSDWQAHDWDDNWGDSRVEVNSTVKNHWLSTFGNGTRYIHSGSTPTQPTCSDGIRNQGEDDIDCGGPCPACQNPPSGTCGEFGVTYIDDNTIRVYHKDLGWTASWQYICLNGYCIPGIKADGYYYQDFDATLGQTYSIEFKAEDSNSSSGQYLSGEKTVTFTTDQCSFTSNQAASLKSQSLKATKATCDEFGVTYIDDNTIRVYHKDLGWTASWQYVCLNGYCIAGEKADGYYYQDYDATLGQTYTIEFKAQDSNSPSGQYLSGEKTVTFTTDQCSFTGGQEPTCSDGIQNQGEDDVDCGGPCPACTTEPTCNDGIQNQGEDDVDCGGPCPACTTEPTCNDGIQNQGEDDVDCGGPCPACQTGTDPLAGAKLLPPNKKVLMSIGQDNETLNDYNNSSYNFPEMGATVGYISLYSLLSGENPAYGALGEYPDGSVYPYDVNWGSGPLHLHNCGNGYPNSALIIGLSFAEGDDSQTWCSGCVAQVANGGWDDEIKRLAKFCKDYNGPVYIRVGVEFDGKWNHGYEPSNFAAAFRQIVTVMRDEKADNVAFIWQACTSPIDDILEGGKEDVMAWWPGDSYVDWLGISFFLKLDERPNVSGFVSTQRTLMDDVLKIARDKNKPVFVSESTPQGYDLANLTEAYQTPVWDGPSYTNVTSKSASQIWDEWFTPFFDYIHTNADIIRGVTYINTHWESQPKWSDPWNEGYWGDARIQANGTIASNWNNELSDTNFWQHGSSNINNILKRASISSPEEENTMDISQPIFVYPVPAEDYLNVNGVDESFKYTIYSIGGIPVLSGQGAVIDLTEVDSGMYILKSSSNKTIRFVKK